jgi:bifunctional non-homologous end joining protein LigD
MPSRKQQVPGRQAKRRPARAATAAGVAITHPDKVLFPADGITKQDLADYYQMIAPHMLPHVVGRPVTLERFHRGIGEKGIFQKNVVKGFPEWLERVEVAKKDGSVHHPVVRDVRGLLWLANQNSITPHVWTSRAPKLMKPDIMIFDLDPSEDDNRRLCDAALLLRDLLAELGLESWVKTSGSKGLHIAVPLDGRTQYDTVAGLAHRIGELLVERDPGNLTREFYKKDRGGRILVDTGRNEYSATFAATYAVRPRPGAPVSAPCRWEEIEARGVTPTTFTLRNMAARVRDVGDLWAGLLASHHSVTRLATRLRDRR